MVYKFTKKAQSVIQIANEIAIELGHNYVKRWSSKQSIREPRYSA